MRDRVAADKVDERAIRSHLYHPDMPDPDLVMRTSGEYRISNFLLWELAYAELVFTDVLWPDFRREHLFDAIVEFQGRSRRYGGSSGERAPPTASPRRSRRGSPRCAGASSARPSHSRVYAGLWVLVAAGATSLEGVLVTFPVIAVLIAGGNWLQHWLGIQRRAPQFSGRAGDAEHERRAPAP